MTRRLVAALAALGALLGSTATATAPADYSLDAEAWNGVGYLKTTAEEARVEILFADEVDLDRLRPGDILLWLFPTAPLPHEELLAFVRDGGYLLLADDRGHSTELLAVLDIRRDTAGPAEHSDYYQGVPGLPTLTPQREHFLFFNVDAVTANHPAALRGPGEPILSFDSPDDHLVIERRYGEGAVLAMGDASIFLNQMLRRFYGNKQFAANCMRLYCDRDLCPVTVALPGARAHGHYRAGLGRLGRLPSAVEDAAAAVDAALADLDAALARSPWRHTLAALALLALAALLARLARTHTYASDTRDKHSRTRHLDGAPPLVGDIPGTSPLRQETAGLVLGHREADFAQPARVLVREVERLERAPALARALESREDRRVASPPTIARNALLRIQREADSLRGPAPAVVSAERFLRLLSDVRTVCRFLEDKPALTGSKPGAPRAAATRDGRRPLR